MEGMHSVHTQWAESGCSEVTSRVPPLLRFPTWFLGVVSPRIPSYAGRFHPTGSPPLSALSPISESRWLEEWVCRCIKSFLFLCVPAARRLWGWGGAWAWVAGGGRGGCVRRGGSGGGGGGGAPPARPGGVACVWGRDTHLPVPGAGAVAACCWAAGCGGRAVGGAPKGRPPAHRPPSLAPAPRPRHVERTSHACTVTQEVKETGTRKPNFAP